MDERGGLEQYMLLCGQIADEVRRELESKLGSGILSGAEVIGLLHGFCSALDEQWTKIKDRFACAGGCAWCCRQQVLCSPAEALYIGKFLNDHLSADLPEDHAAIFRDLAATIRWTAERTADMNGDQFYESGLGCPLLLDGWCLIYDARPFICRAIAVYNKKACTEGPNATVVHDAHWLALCDGIQAGVSDFLESRGLDHRPVRLHLALAAALDDPGLFERWMRGERMPESVRVPLSEVQEIVADHVRLNP